MVYPAFTLDFMRCWLKKYGKEELSWKLILKKEEEKNKAVLFGSPD